MVRSLTARVYRVLTVNYGFLFTVVFVGGYTIDEMFLCAVLWLWLSCIRFCPGDTFAAVTGSLGYPDLRTRFCGWLIVCLIVRLIDWLTESESLAEFFCIFLSIDDCNPFTGHALFLSGPLGKAAAVDEGCILRHGSLLSYGKYSFFIQRRPHVMPLTARIPSRGPMAMHWWPATASFRKVR